MIWGENPLFLKTPIIYIFSGDFCCQPNFTKLVEGEHDELQGTCFKYMSCPAKTPLDHWWNHEGEERRPKERKKSPWFDHFPTTTNQHFFVCWAKIHANRIGAPLLISWTKQSNPSNPRFEDKKRGEVPFPIFFLDETVPSLFEIVGTWNESRAVFCGDGIFTGTFLTLVHTVEGNECHLQFQLNQKIMGIPSKTPI